MKPQIVVPDYGKHNADMEGTVKRVTESSAWKKLDTVMIIPAGGQVPTKTALSWLNMYSAPNNQFFRLPTVGAINMEVGEAFTQTIQYILDHPQLSKFKYILTAEHDNIPPPDGLVKLQQQMEAHPEYDCIGGLYFTKGEGGMPQIWGDPRDPTSNFRPNLRLLGSWWNAVGLAWASISGVWICSATQTSESRGLRRRLKAGSQRKTSISGPMREGTAIGVRWIAVCW